MAWGTTLVVMRRTASVASAKNRVQRFVNVSVNGSAMRNSAPAASARSRISGEPSEVTKPKGTFAPARRSASSSWMPVISGTLQ